MPNEPQSLVTYHPFATFSDGNLGRFFLSQNGINGLKGWGNAIGENADREALWVLGKNAYDKLPEIKDAAEFDEGLRGFYEYVRDARAALGALIKAGKLKLRGSSGSEIEAAWVDDAEPSAIIGLSWNIGNTRGLIDDDDINEIFLQLFCYACLLEIDNALIGTCLDGRAAVASALEASEANSNAVAIASRDARLQAARKQLALQAAISRYRKDPKQKAKQLVFDCWKAWRNKPDSYPSQAAFARDMLDKGWGLTSQPSIEAWCRGWKKKRNKANSSPEQISQE